jgi:catechol 2,3-dioxygenase-like lactoylglutathione lyase family enzyme
MSSTTALATGVNVVAIYVTDLKKAKDFYINILGLKEKDSTPPGVMLEAGDFPIYLEGDRSGKVNPGVKKPTTSVVFETKSVKTAYERLKGQGVQIEQGYVAYGDEFAVFRISDPDGNVIEFTGKP